MTHIPKSLIPMPPPPCKIVQKKNPVPDDVRRRRDNYNLRARIQRHNDLLNTFISPGAIAVARLGLVPKHLDAPFTRAEIKKYITECNTIFYHSTWAKPNSSKDVMNGPIFDLDLPRLKMPISPDLERPATDGLIKLENKYVMSIKDLQRWFYQGFKRYMFKVIHENTLYSCGGEWALMYESEILASFPELLIYPGRKRIWYLVQITRDTDLSIIEVSIYSPDYYPILSIGTTLGEGSVIPEEYRAWWNQAVLPLPPDRIVVD